MAKTISFPLPFFLPLFFLPLSSPPFPSSFPSYHSLDFYLALIGENKIQDHRGRRWFKHRFCLQTCALAIIIAPQLINMHLYYYGFFGEWHGYLPHSIMFCLPWIFPVLTLGVSLVAYVLYFDILLSLSRFKYVQLTVNEAGCSTLKGIGFSGWSMSILSAIDYSMCPKDKQYACQWKYCSHYIHTAMANTKLHWFIQWFKTRSPN